MGSSQNAASQRLLEIMFRPLRRFDPASSWAIKDERKINFMPRAKWGWTAGGDAGHKRGMLHRLAVASAWLSLSALAAAPLPAALLRDRAPLIGFDAPARMAPRPAKRLHSITVPIPPVARGIALPKVEGPSDASRPLVVIDAGHGGHDPGAISVQRGVREKDVTLGIAQAIRDQLVKGGRVRVALTRDDDRFLVLQERYGIARKLNADLFLSIHADSADNPDAQGATVYTLSETASDREAARLAARENRADMLNGVNLGGQSGDVSSILIDLTQRETMNVSANFARLLRREAGAYMPFRQVYHRFASLMVLKAPDTPSLLFETGYLSNVRDAAFLSSAKGQADIGRGVARAIEVHFARRLAPGAP